MAQRKKVLVIDDDPAVCELIQRTLEQRDFAVTSAQDARAGFETAQRLLPDLIFLKLLLPGIDGLKVSKAIHAVPTLKTVPIVMIVAQQGELDPRYTAVIGIVDVLVRPLNPQEIIAKTDAVLGETPVKTGGLQVAPVFDDEDIEPAIVIDTYEEAEDAAPAPVIQEGLDVPGRYGEREDSGARGPVEAATDKEDVGLPPREFRYDREDDTSEEQDLFSAVTASSGDEKETIGHENDHGPEVPDRAVDYSADDDPLTGELPPSPVRRALLAGASIIAGIALGVGGYLFFSAGNKQAPARNQVTEVLPDPAMDVPAAPGASAGKQNVIPEIPVKQEPPFPGKAVPADSPRQKRVPAEGKTSAQTAGAPAGSAKKERAGGDIPAGSYYVQAGVFASRDNAEALAEKIREKGFAASVKEMEGADRKSLYRVVAGTAVSRSKALELSESLKGKGIKTIVQQR